jgi:hypothetical protein
MWCHNVILSQVYNPYDAREGMEELSVGAVHVEKEEKFILDEFISYNLTLALRP